MDDYSLLDLATQHDDELALLDLLDYRCTDRSGSAAGKAAYYRQDEDELGLLQSLAGLGSHQELVFLKEEEKDPTAAEWDRGQFWDRQEGRLSSEHRSLWSVEEGEDYSAIFDGDDEGE